MKNTLVIGDCHGHFNRLEALLLQAEIIDADGKRINQDVEVVQLGDLGHFGGDTKLSDKTIWERAPAWLDVILWGNHDRAVVDGNHAFYGYAQPYPATEDAMDACRNSDKLRLAHAAHGFLLTHAGLSSKLYGGKEDLHLPEMDPVRFAEWLNVSDLRKDPTPRFAAICDAVGRSRGGRYASGGILWRDAEEPLYDGFPQVFGHSAAPQVREYDSRSWCVDIGTQYNGRLAAIWLPQEIVVEIEVDDPKPEETPQTAED